MANKKRNEHSQEEKRIAFASMKKTYDSCLEAKNFIGAHVVAFSFLEDRVTAMNVVRGVIGPGQFFAKKVRHLRAAGDIPQEFETRLLDAAKERNDLVHAAMWNLSVFSAEKAEHVFDLARQADSARKRQKTRLQR